MSIFEKLSQLEQQLDQVKNLANRFISSAKSILNDGDRVWFSYIDSFKFSQDSNEVQNINFNVSGDSDFIARRLTLSLTMHREDTQGNTIANDLDGFFRPSSFSYDELETDSSVKIDCQIDITHMYTRSDGSNIVKKINNQPIPAYLTYSHNGQFGSPSALHFDIDWDIKRGTTVQCKISIVSSISGQPASIVDTYKIKGILEGYKKVRSFK